MSPHDKNTSPIASVVGSSLGLKRTVKEAIGDRIEDLIASGILQLGDELPSERELAKMLSVSRETVRGAIQTLSARGIVSVSQGARTRVANVSVAQRRGGLSTLGTIDTYDLETVHASRLLVERAVVADAARHISAQTLAFLDASLVAQHEVLDDPMRFLIYDREFHLAIYHSASNPLLADFVTDLYTYMLDRRRVAMSKPDAMNQSYEDHAAIVEALRSHDPEATSLVFDRHINRIYATSKKLMGSGSQ
ncbi:FadR/GntR family transcriptional regulator [Beijerinckia indica]|uniref:Regulatory protein GntR HTH n=1 Tax=Beijerinckia indica subsp. indica (strain ATCC 9039 / DSM 1715 / NCIMB 8712) TaxID=395963 RepID=B2IFW1_BEII9|nr:FadR/GntR family transcriptional regulator [Beijerinckia indica]ACB95700.1 regulatory protein GntR HTH [Beijerinckia indica subsp. indica ATCC 9039]